MDSVQVPITAGAPIPASGPVEPDSLSKEVLDLESGVLAMEFISSCILSFHLSTNIRLMFEIAFLHHLPLLHFWSLSSMPGFNKPCKGGYVAQFVPKINRV